MTYVCKSTDDTRFIFRVGGLAISNERVLLNRGVNDPYWFIPGGKIELGEDSISAIMREMKEEIDQKIEVVNIICTIENFFIENAKRHHEVGIYYSIKVPKEWAGSKYIEDGGGKLEYKWILISELKEIALYPEVMKDIISGNKVISHYIVGKEDLKNYHPWRKSHDRIY